MSVNGIKGSKQRAELRRLIRERDGDDCLLCGRPMDFTAHPLSPEFPTIEHKVAKSANGSNDIGNLTLAHRRCNEKRADKPLLGHMRRARTGPLPNPVKGARHG